MSTTATTMQPPFNGSQEVVSFAIYDAHQNKALQNHSFQSITVNSGEECFNACVKNRPRCKAFNMGSAINGKLACELNSERKDDVSQSYFTDRKGTVYFELIV